MPLKPCRECKTAVSSEAPTCPSCGVKNPVVTISSLLPELIKGSAGLFLLYLLFGPLSGLGSSPSAVPTASAPTIVAAQKSNPPVENEAEAAYKVADMDFYQCMKHRASKEDLPFYSEQTQANTYSQLVGECYAEYASSIQKCRQAGRTDGNCTSTAEETAVRAVTAVMWKK